MGNREEIMQERGILECPTWCTQDPVDEPDYEQHLGAWATPVDNGGADGDLTIEVRPIRQWWEEGDEADVPGHVNIYLAGAGFLPHSPMPAGVVADGWLTPDDAEALADALTQARDEAQSPSGWVWAYPGAEDDAHATEEERS